MKILIACEESQTVCKAFREKGHDAFSCDLLDCSGGHPEWHYKTDVLEVINMGWDLMIAHPPCTWLCQAMRTNAARKDRPNITPIFYDERQKGFDFFMALYNAPIKMVAVENPIGYINSAFRKPDQIIRPWMFGDGYKKDVCLWLRGLPKLIWDQHDNLFSKKTTVPGRKKLDFWSNKRNPGGVSLKSKTFPGIAKAMAEQWG